MGFKPKITIKLVKCGTCGRSYNNPLSHVCKVRLDSKTAQRRIAKKRGKR